MGREDEASTQEMSGIAPVIVTGQYNALYQLQQYAARLPRTLAFRGVPVEPTPVRVRPRPRTARGSRGAAQRIEEFQYKPKPLTKEEIDARINSKISYKSLAEIMAQPFDFKLLPTEVLAKPVVKVASVVSTPYEALTVVGRRTATANPQAFMETQPAQPRIRTTRPTIGSPQRRGTLTPQRSPSVRSRTKTLADVLADMMPKLTKPPATKTKVDECAEKRKRDRKQCPARGYRLQATKWRKVPCL